MKLQHYVVKDEDRNYHGFILDGRLAIATAGGGGHDLWVALSYLSHWYSSDNVRQVDGDEWQKLAKGIEFTRSWERVAEFLTPEIIDDMISEVDEELKPTSYIDHELEQALFYGRFMLPVDTAYGLREWIVANVERVAAEAVEVRHVASKEEALIIPFAFYSEDFDEDEEEWVDGDTFLPPVASWDDDGGDVLGWLDAMVEAGERSDGKFRVDRYDGRVGFVYITRPAITQVAVLDIGKAVEMFRSE